MSTLQSQASQVWNEFNEIYYYPNMKRGGPLEVELIVSPKCNLACKYCYVNRYYHQVYPDDMYDPQLVIENSMKYLKALTKKGLAPNIDIFSGEFLAQKVGYDLLEEMYNYYKDLPLDLRPKTIVIPSNFTFICSDELTQHVKDLIHKFWSIDIFLYLSASVEGKILEENRPASRIIDLNLEVVRDDAYYDKVLEFMKEFGFGCHPMVAAEGIEKWIDNFNWWQEMLKKHDMPWDSIYLLEVRNADYWTEEQLLEYKKFLRYIFNFAIERCKATNIDFLDWCLKLNHSSENNDDDDSVGWTNGFNILMQPFSTNANGIGCNIQPHTAVRCADLMVVPCHRLMYEQFHIGKIVIDDNYDMHFDTINAELGLTLPMINADIFPKCNTCPINQCCIQGCLGAQYEATGDLFTPIPTICRMMYVKLATLIDCWKESGYWEQLVQIINPKILKQLLRFYYEKCDKGDT